MFEGIYRNRRVLITGHTGFKGSWLAKWMLEQGANVAGFSDKIPTSPSLFEALNLSSELRDYRGDIRSYETLKKACDDFAPQVVFHLAAQAFVSEGYQSPKATFDTNVSGTVNLLEALRHSSHVEAIVVVTSDKCYENRGNKHSYSEADPLGGQDPYSASKGCAELVVGAYIRSFLQGADTWVASVRAGNVIGGGDWGVDRLIPDCIRAWQAGESVTLRYPAATRPWQHVLDCLSGYLWVGHGLLKGEAGIINEAFNFGPLDQPSVSVGEVVAKLSDHWEGGLWETGGKPFPKEATTLALASDKALTRLPWNPSIPLDSAIKQTAEWYKAYYQHEDMTAWSLSDIRDYEACNLKRPISPAYL